MTEIRMSLAARLGAPVSKFFCSYVGQCVTMLSFGHGILQISAAGRPAAKPASPDQWRHFCPEQYRQLQDRQSSGPLASEGDAPKSDKA